MGSHLSGSFVTDTEPSTEGNSHREELYECSNSSNDLKLKKEYPIP